MQNESAFFMEANFLDKEEMNVFLKAMKGKSLTN